VDTRDLPYEEQRDLWPEVLPMSGRRKVSEEAYQLAKRTGKTRELKDVPSIKDFKYWRIIPNDYPADIMYKASHMLIPKRVTPSWKTLNQDEFDELWFILDTIEKEEVYDCISLNPPKRRSIHNHFHIHLAVFVDSREKMGL